MRSVSSRLDVRLNNTLYILSMYVWDHALAEDVRIGRIPFSQLLERF